MTSPRPCPCGSLRDYAQCCEPLHAGREQAATAERLMRSRYAAYVVGDAGYLARTWHPRTRPDELGVERAGWLGRTEWLGLEIVDTVAGGAHDETGEVAFIARFRGGEQRERSRFARRAGRWVYVDGDTVDGDA